MRFVVNFLMVLGIWLILSVPSSGEDLLAGIAVAGLVGIFSSRFFPEHPAKLLDPRRWGWMILYMPYFFYYCVRANLDVVYRVVHPEVPINPGIVKIRTSLKSEIAQAMLANSITLTPGTLSVDVRDGDIYVHWIDVKSQEVEEASRIITQKFEGYLKEIFE